MSPTSYQTAPPRISIIINGWDIVKLPRCFGRASRFLARSKLAFGGYLVELTFAHRVSTIRHWYWHLILGEAWVSMKIHRSDCRIQDLNHGIEQPQVFVHVLGNLRLLCS